MWVLLSLRMHLEHTCAKQLPDLFPISSTTRDCSAAPDVRQGRRAPAGAVQRDALVPGSLCVRLVLLLYSRQPKEHHW